MSTTLTPQPVVTLHPISAYIKAHERLVLAVIAGLALWLAIGKVDTLIANHDHAVLQQAQVVAQVQQQKNDELVKQMAKHDAETQALTDKIEARDAQLTQLQAQLVDALTKQQAVDRTMTPTELTQRWNTLVPEASVSIINGQITLPDTGAQATVAELEKAPVLTQQLAAKDEQITNAQTLLASESQKVQDRDALITGLRAKSVDDAKVCSAQIKVIKAEARKSKRRWFVAGFITGFLSRQAIKTYLGL